MAGPKRTMRRVPEDVAEATYIRDLITADVNAKAGDLAAGGPEKQDQLYTLLDYKKRWQGIVSDLSEPDEAPAQVVPPQTREGGQGVTIPVTAADANTSGEAAASSTDAEGGVRTNRTARQRSA